MTNETDWVYLEQLHKARLELDDIAAIGMMGWEAALEENKRLAAEVEALRAQVPPAGVVGAIADMWAERWGQVAGEDVPDFVTIVEDWLSTLPTQEAQP